VLSQILIQIKIAITKAYNKQNNDLKNHLAYISANYCFLIIKKLGPSNLTIIESLKNAASRLN